MTATQVAEFALVRIEWAILAYFVFVNSWYLVLLVCAAGELRRRLHDLRGQGRRLVIGSPLAPSISVIAPAYNEERTIVSSVKALLALQYPSLEVVVVNDGSPDGTMAALRDAFALIPIHPVFVRILDHREIRALYRSRTHPNLVVAEKENGGKADALNAGLNIATGELVCALDADSLVEGDALIRMVRPFLSDPTVAAAGGTVRVANGCVVEAGRVTVVRAPRRALAGIQAVEYLRAFLFGRLGWNALGGNLIVSGAFGLFRRDSVVTAGGYLADTVGEDVELVARIRRAGVESGRPSRIVFIPDPVAWTEVPETFRVLGRQRDRWHRGLADTLFRHASLAFNPRFGALGLVVYPYFFAVELCAPVVEAIGLAGLAAGLWIDAVDWGFAALFFLVAYGYGLVLTVTTFLLEELSFHRYETARDRALLLLWAVLENFGYRQLTVFWRLRGILGFLRRRTDWGVMERRGFGATA